MKFYIASGLQNHEQVRSLAKLLKNSGWTHTYDWTSLLYDRTSHVSEKTTEMCIRDSPRHSLAMAATY